MPWLKVISISTALVTPVVLEQDLKAYWAFYRALSRR